MHKLFHHVVLKLLLVLIHCKKKIIEQIEYSGNKNAAAVVGENIAKLAIESGITSVAFDRSGFKYHGRVKALADAARENGLKF